MQLQLPLSCSDCINCHAVEWSQNQKIDRRTTLAQSKEELVPLIGVPDSLMDMHVPVESKFVLRLAKALQVGEYRIKLFLLHVNNTVFFII
uniref:Uncharacterized protein n=1 Tax=Amphimedon queenslandica TaxID=400682 RepID=A0A1X7V3J3_AMPQE